MPAADFQRVAIVGCGLIGGSIRLALADRGAAVEVIALDRGDDLEAAADAQLVILSAPVLENIRMLPRLRGCLSSGTIITDTGSTKAAIVAAADGMRFVGGHPIAGGTASGAPAADAGLFEGRPWMLTPGRGVSPGDVTRVRTFVETLGATVHLLDPDEHDRLFAFISHLPQLAVSALMHVAGAHAGAEGLALAGAGLRDSTRLAGSAPGIWADIVQTNHANIAASLDAFIAVLTRLRDDAGGGELREIFESAGRWKRTLAD